LKYPDVRAVTRLSFPTKAGPVRLAFVVFWIVGFRTIMLKDGKQVGLLGVYLPVRNPAPTLR